jgi:hypothetical protein
MSLRDRLEAAKAERRQRAGLPAEAPEVSPMDLPIATRDHTDSDQDPSIDLRGYAPVVDLRHEFRQRSSEPSFSSALQVGEGAQCPHCGGRGRVDMEDVVGGVDHYSCTACGLLYQVAR